MSLQARHTQKGATLLVGMIMLVVLTLLVVFAIRSGNTNLKIAGNMQSQTEASAATQQLIEQVVAQIALPNTDISLIPAQKVTVSIGNSSYNVSVTAMKNQCIFSTPVLNSSLSTSNPNDVPCFETTDEDKAITASGNLTTKPSACSTQQWEIDVKATDNLSGVEVNQIQGVSVRVPSTTSCL